MIMKVFSELLMTLVMGNIKKSSKCLIKFQLFLKALLSRTETLEFNIIVKGILV